MKLLLLIVLGGFAGTLCRYGITRIPWNPSFPFGTLTVNLTGAFLAGFCSIWLKTKFSGYSQYFPVLFIGFLGAFTTFSTFALESSRMFLDGQMTKFFLNLTVQNVLGIACAVGGILLAKHVI